MIKEDMEAGLTAKSTVFLILLVIFSESSFGQRQLVKRAVKAPLDLGAEINAQIALLPVVGGYPAGTITIPPGEYFQSTPVVVNSPRLSIVGANSGAVQITCTMNGPCWEVRLTPFVVLPIIGMGGQIGGFTLNGLASNANGVGIHLGDITSIRLEDIAIQAFTGANAAGMWWDNINGWTERMNVQRVNLSTNTTNFRFTSSGSANNSFCYNQILDLRMNVGGNEKGIDFQSGWLCGSTLMMVVNGFGPNKTYINIAGESQWNDNLYDIKVEDDGGGGLRLATAPGTQFTGEGRITNIAGPMLDSINGSFALFLPFIYGTPYSSTTAPARWWTDQFGNLQVESSLPATASNNFNAPLVALNSSCWNGSATAVDRWQFQNVIGSGANPSSTLQFGFTPLGCTATAEVQVADGVGNGILLSTSALGVSPRIRHDGDDNLVIDTGGPIASLYLNTDNNKPVKLGAGGTTGANIPIIAALSTTAGNSTNVSMPGVTSSSHCSLTATSASAGANIGGTFVSAKLTDQITVAHAPIAGMTYDVLCTPN
jgi:hypothetical protein